MADSKQKDEQQADQLRANGTHEPTHPAAGLKNDRTSRITSLIFIGTAIIAAGIIVYFANHSGTNNSPSGNSTANYSLAKVAAGQVDITASGFSPSTITVVAGQAVVWINQDTAPHQVASDPFPSNNILPDLNSRQPLSQNDSYSYIFNKSGTYTYHDNLHPSLGGKVIVQ